MERYPSCPRCYRPFEPGSHWLRSNYCKGLYLLTVIASVPNQSTWELAQQTGLAYDDASKGLQKLRDWRLVTWIEEQRAGQEGTRYRYHVSPDWQQRTSSWACEPALSGRF